MKIFSETKLKRNSKLCMRLSKGAVNVLLNLIPNLLLGFHHSAQSINFCINLFSIIHYRYHSSVLISITNFGLELSSIFFTCILLINVTIL
jgi:hypothetical protein